MARAGLLPPRLRPTRELLDRLTPARKQIVWPHEPFERTPNLKPGFEETDATELLTKQTDGRGG